MVLSEHPVEEHAAQQGEAQFVPKVFYSVSTVCLPRQSVLYVQLSHLVCAKFKGHFYNFQQSAITYNRLQYGNYRTSGTFDDTHASCYTTWHISCWS